MGEGDIDGVLEVGEGGVESLWGGWRIDGGGGIVGEGEDKGRVAGVCVGLGCVSTGK